MAAREFTKSFYELLDDMGGDQSTHALNALLDGLVRWMQGHKLEEFVKDYRQTCEVKTKKERAESDLEDAKRYLNKLSKDLNNQDPASLTETDRENWRQALKEAKEDVVIFTNILKEYK